ncbi:hypothetical protein FH972_016162 [Carpinus fangiana]|uniref:Uncharacterized protein n=1 Tax=Carpinus fangiana TaxID=176857 RepID=A0A5N6RIJ4_9ROSI|nr:hypothetical protein FH972_016162 [Carpinus fangiana]
MLCSVPPAGKSGSNWLDRLRSNRGFPTTTSSDNNDDDNNDNLGLDHFLRNQNPSESTRSNSGSTQSDHERVADRTHEKEHQPQQQLYNLMSNVLSELFFMDGDTGNTQSSKLSGKKFPRKQTAPKSLTTSTTNNNSHLQREEEEKSPACTPKDENARTTASFGSDNRLTKVKEGNVEAEEEERELVGYSASEVTVIDTSFGVWKSEKVVFRRKNVWKVREKRRKVRSFGRKKRKGNGGCDVDDEIVGELMKKPKVSGSESVAGSNRGQNPQNDLREEVCKDTPDDLTQVPKKRFPFSRSPRKSGKGSSSVILIKGMLSSKKHGGKILKKCHEDTRR